MRKAIAIANEKLGLKPGEQVRVVSLPRPQFSFGSLLREVGILADEPAPLPALLTDPIERLALLAALSTEPAVMMMPFFLTIK